MHVLLSHKKYNYIYYLFGHIKWMIKLIFIKILKT